MFRTSLGPIAAWWAACLVTGGVNAQLPAHDHLDPLTRIWADTRMPDSARFDALETIVHDLRHSARPDSLLRLSQELQAFARQHALMTREGEAWNMIGMFQNNLNRWDSAETAYLKALDFFERTGHHERMAGVYNNLGNVMCYKGVLPKAIDYYTRGLRIGEAMRDSSVVARLLGNIGVTHYDQAEYPVALEYFKKRIALAERINDRQCAVEAYICIAMTRQKQGLQAEALKGFVKSLQLAHAIDDKTSILTCQSSLGSLLIDAGDIPLALTYLDSSLTLARAQADPMLESTAWGEIARARHLQGNEVAALEAADQALNSARIANTQEAQRDALRIGYIVLKAMGRTAEALERHELYLAMRDSLTNDANRKQVMGQRFQYEYEKKEMRLMAEQEKKDAVAAEELRRKNVQRNAFIGGFALMVLLAGVFFAQRNRISREKERSEELLLNILPQEVADELKHKGHADAKHFDQATILFTDFKGFTQLSEKVTPAELVAELNTCFKAFDGIIGKYRIEKIKTIGDAYMAAGGLPDPQHGSPADVVCAALEMQAFMKAYKAEREAEGKPFFEMRVGIHTGPVVAGIVGVKKFQYDIWGDTVNTASRMESSGEVGQVNISEATYALVKSEPGLTFTPRGKVQAKGKGEMEMYYVSHGLQRA